MARVWLCVVALAMVSVAGGHRGWSRWRHPSCPRVNCCWSDWSSWTPCAGDCTQFRFRSVAKQQSCGGTTCLGSSYERRVCPQPCHRGHVPSPEPQTQGDAVVSRTTLIAVGASAALIILALSLALMYVLLCRVPGGSRLSDKKVVPVETDTPPAYEEKERF